MRCDTLYRRHDSVRWRGQHRFCLFVYLAPNLFIWQCVCVCPGERQESIEMRSMSIGRDWMNGKNGIDCCYCCCWFSVSILMRLWTAKNKKRFCRRFYDNLKSMIRIHWKASLSQSHRFIAYFHFLDTSFPIVLVSVCAERIVKRWFVRIHWTQIDSIWNGEVSLLKNHFRSNSPRQWIECIRMCVAVESIIIVRHPRTLNEVGLTEMHKGLHIIEFDQFKTVNPFWASWASTDIVVRSDDGFTFKHYQNSGIDFSHFKSSNDSTVSFDQSSKGIPIISTNSSKLVFVFNLIYFLSNPANIWLLLLDGPAEIFDWKNPVIMCGAPE